MISLASGADHLGSGDQLASCYLLHVRPYRETSALVVGFFANFGRVDLVLHRARGKGRHGNHSPQLFTPFAVQFSGRSELKSVRRIERAGATIGLTGDRLFSGLYLNELLERVLKASESQPEIYQLYLDCLARLSGEAPLEPTLRQFEWQLLEYLGYGLQFEWDNLGEAIEPQRDYYYRHQEGWSVTENLADDRIEVFSGATLQQLAQRNWHQAEFAKAAKRLSRLALAPLLGAKPLVSRSLFRVPAQR